MNTELFQTVAIISIAATFLAIVSGVIVVVKFLFDLSTRVTNLETKLSDRITELKVENIKLQSRFDKYDGVNTELEKRVAEIQSQQFQIKEQVVENQNQTNAKFLQIEAENKNYIKELTNKVLEVFPKSAL